MLTIWLQNILLSRLTEESKPKALQSESEEESEEEEEEELTEEEKGII